MHAYPYAVADTTDGKLTPALLHNQLSQLPGLISVHLLSETSFQVEFDAPLSAPDEATLTALVEAHLGGSGTFLESKYEVVSYDSGGLVKTISRYATDNGNGTYSDLVEQTTYFYTDSKLTKTEKRLFDSSGLCVNLETANYYSNDSGDRIRKLV
jgi:hypothetical protein